VCVTSAGRCDIAACHSVKTNLMETSVRMKHLDLYAPDVQATTDFMTKYFGLKLVEMRGQGGRFSALPTNRRDLSHTLRIAIDRCRMNFCVSIGVSDTSELRFTLPIRTSRQSTRIKGSGGSPGDHARLVACPGHTIAEVAAA
jgi:Glyoxalase/Bleomycin resistance protein/Dioxygenase superfamily